MKREADRIPPARLSGATVSAMAALWLIPAVPGVARGALVLRAAGRSDLIAGTMLIDVSCWLVYAALTPLIVLACARFPLAWSPRSRAA